MTARRGVVAAAGLATLLCVAPDAHAQRGVSDRYDHVFRKYTKRFFGVAFDWRLFKAQAIVESNLDPSARSRAGARGIMQLMPATSREVHSKNPDLRVLNDVERNIAAGIGHAREQWVLWRADADEPHWSNFMLGSYNAGRATLLRAQRLARERGLNQRVWSSIELVAPAVPRWRYDETLKYVVRVHSSLSAMDPSGRIRAR